MTSSILNNMDSNSIHPKGWGFEYWIVNNEKYCGKMLCFDKEKRCSWHFHKLKDETFFVHQGLFVVFTSENDDILKADIHVLGPGQSLHIPPLLRHQMYAVEDSVLYEFSTTHYEYDSYRITKGD